MGCLGCPVPPRSWQERSASPCPLPGALSRAFRASQQVRRRGIAVRAGGGVLLAFLVKMQQAMVAQALFCVQATTEKLCATSRRKKGNLDRSPEAEPSPVRASTWGRPGVGLEEDEDGAADPAHSGHSRCGSVSPAPVFSPGRGQASCGGDSGHQCPIAPKLPQELGTTGEERDCGGGKRSAIAPRTPVPTKSWAGARPPWGGVRTFSDVKNISSSVRPRQCSWALNSSRCSLLTLGVRAAGGPRGKRRRGKRGGFRGCFAPQCCEWGARCLLPSLWLFAPPLSAGDVRAR